MIIIMSHTIRNQRFLIRKKTFIFDVEHTGWAEIRECFTAKFNQIFTFRFKFLVERKYKER